MVTVRLPNVWLLQVNNLHWTLLKKLPDLFGSFFYAVAIVLAGIFSLDEAIRAIDFNTITLLLGMMIVISSLEMDGFFALIAQKTVK